ncbi:hypothetical protein HMP09_2519 [Sphingomonas sp. HMP9]|nr:hypothetical protein HMP09_2519 [Sphingomonas sp. HMP9]
MKRAKVSRLPRHVTETAKVMQAATSPGDNTLPGTSSMLPRTRSPDSDRKCVTQIASANSRQPIGRERDQRRLICQDDSSSVPMTSPATLVGQEKTWMQSIMPVMPTACMHQIPAPAAAAAAIRPPCAGNRVIATIGTPTVRIPTSADTVVTNGSYRSSRSGRYARMAMKCVAQTPSPAASASAPCRQPNGSRCEVLAMSIVSSDTDQLAVRQIPTATTTR